MQAVTVHKAKHSDAPALTQMAQALAAYEGEQSMATIASIQQLLAGEGQPQCYCLLAKCQSEHAGFVLFYAGYDLSSTSEGFHVADLFVHEAYRGQGVGSALLQAVASEAKAQQRAWVSLTALRSNVAAKQFYQAKGFVRAPVDFYAIGANGLSKL